MPNTPTAATSSSSTPAKLLRFFIYNPKFGPREGEEEKRIVFYHNSGDDDDDTETKCKHVGFAEAAANFARVFSGTSRFIRCVETTKTRTAMLQPEEDFGLVMTVALPAKRTKKTKTATATEYASEDVHDAALRASLEHAYAMFAFFVGRFGEVLALSDGDLDLFRDRVSAFFSKFVLSSSLYRSAHGGAEDLFREVQFLTLDSGDFLRVAAFVNRIKDEFPAVSAAVFFQQGNVVWTDLQQEDTRLLYHYVATNLLPSTVGGGQGQSYVAAEGGRFQGHQGRFITGGPTKLNEEERDWKTPRVNIDWEDEDSGETVKKQHHLIAYHAVSSTVCLMVPASLDPPLSFYRGLDAFAGPALTNMSADLLGVFGSGVKSSSSVSSNLSALLSPSDPTAPPLPSSNVRYIYFNKFNRSMKSTLIQPLLPHETEGDVDPVVSGPVMRMVLDLAQCLEGGDNGKASSSSPGEVFVKMSADDRWVLGRRAEHRLVLAVVMGDRCATLMDASEEMEKLVANEFKNVFLDET